jgi:uncharacterized protein
MSGETNLEILLASMEPTLHESPYGFLTVPNELPLAGINDVFAVIREAEGITLVAQIDQLQRMGFSSELQWARITLTVHSSLSAVGLTAAFAKALGDKGISANVIAGYFHDHILVQWQFRHEAMAALASFKK